MYILSNKGKRYMSKLVINTQYKENYGAHDWDGEGVCPQYWKFKGGSTYIVTNLTELQQERIHSNGIPMLSALIEDSNESFQEYILDYSIVEDSAVVCEEWETVTEFTWGGDRWLASKYQDNTDYWKAGIIAKMEKWIPLEAGERSDYSCQYKTATGWHDSDSFLLKAELAA